MIEGKKIKRHFRFDCPISDAEMHFPEIGDILKENNTQIATKKLLEDFIRTGYLTKNNACDINFKHTRINKKNLLLHTATVQILNAICIYSMGI